MGHVRTEGIYLLFFLLMWAFNTVFFQTHVVWSRNNNSRIKTPENTEIPNKRNTSYEDNFEAILPSRNGQTFLTPKISTADLLIYKVMKTRQ